MRVALVTPAPPLRGGIAAYGAALARALEAAGHRVRIASYARQYPRVLFPGSAETAGDTGTLGVAVVDTLWPPSWLRLRRLLRSDPFDLVVAQWWHPITAPALAVGLGGRRPFALLTVCHNIIPHEPFPLSRALARGVLSQADSVLCHSRAVAALAERWAGVCAEVLPMPVVLKAESMRAGGERAPKRHLEYVFAGIIRRYKGVDVLLDAWRRARLPAAARLTIAGESYLGRGRLRALVGGGEAAGNVRLLERWLSDEELWTLLVRADVVVLPYRRATQSAILAAALAAGARIIASDAGGLPETLVSSQRHQVVAAEDAEALARALEAAADAVGHERFHNAARHGCTAASVITQSWVPVVRLCERVAGGAS